MLKAIGAVPTVLVFSAWYVLIARLRSLNPMSTTTGHCLCGAVAFVYARNWTKG
jgi:hypothetical protein